MALQEVIEKIRATSGELEGKTQVRLDNLTKPPGSLGKLEDLAKKMACAFNDKDAKVKKKCVIVFAADHGITEEAVSLFPREVTAQMVLNFLARGAGINVLARHAGADVITVDIGVDADFNGNESLINAKVARGTDNMLHGAAMSADEAQASIRAGYETALSLIEKGYNVIGLGEMGIGNTTVASAVTAAITGIAPGEVTGRGTGIGDDSLRGKIAIIEKVLHINKPDPSNGLDVLSKVGGFELGGIAGAVLACAANNCIAVIDGFISSAGAAIAYLLSPNVADYIVASHRSVEKGHVKLLEFMGLTPVLDLGLRLGEGTGAALCMNVMEGASKILNEMATFESANVSSADE